jgi:hypothetical protein
LRLAFQRIARITQISTLACVPKKSSALLRPSRICICRLDLDGKRASAAQRPASDRPAF